MNEKSGRNVETLHEEELQMKSARWSFLVAMVILVITAGSRGLTGAQQDNRERVIAQVTPSVVLIQVEKALGGTAHGSGFI